MKARWKEALRSELGMSPDTQLVSLQCWGLVACIGSRSAKSSSHPVMFSESTHVCKVLQKQIQEEKGDVEEMCHEVMDPSRTNLDLSHIFTFFSIWVKKNIYLYLHCTSCVFPSFPVNTWIQKKMPVLWYFL